MDFKERIIDLIHRIHKEQSRQKAILIEAERNNDTAHAMMSKGNLISLEHNLEEAEQMLKYIS